MAQFFIRRPVLAWVISIFIVIAGLLALAQIPIAQYPQVAWPQITVSTIYTGSSPAEINQAVAQPIEDELNGVEGLAYYESVSDSSGSMQITATFLKPISGHDEKKGFFGWFNRRFDALTERYTRGVGLVTRRRAVMMLFYVGLVAATAMGFLRLPSSFLPNEDQGFIITDIQTPATASSNRTDEVLATATGVFGAMEPVENVVSIRGFSFSGQGPNAISRRRTSPMPRKCSFSASRMRRPMRCRRRRSPVSAPPAASASACRTGAGRGKRRCWPQQGRSWPARKRAASSPACASRACPRPRRPSSPWTAKRPMPLA